MPPVTPVWWVDPETRDIIFRTWYTDEEFEQVFGRSPHREITTRLGRQITLYNFPVKIRIKPDFYGSEIVCKITEEVCLDATKGLNRPGAEDKVMTTSYLCPECGYSNTAKTGTVQVVCPVCGCSQPRAGG